MNVQVRLFAVARQLAGHEIVTLDLPEGSTVEGLRVQLAAEYPELAPLLPHVLFAVGSEYVGDGHTLAETPEIACIPPVSGG
jgi:molybdopterin synthase catalytic subunit/molybdopterin synthase sulfur carrier subunit